MKLTPRPPVILDKLYSSKILRMLKRQSRNWWITHAQKRPKTAVYCPVYSALWKKQMVLEPQDCENSIQMVLDPQDCESNAFMYRNCVKFITQ